MPGMSPLWVPFAKAATLLIILATAFQAGFKNLHILLLISWYLAFKVIAYFYFRKIYILDEADLPWNSTNRSHTKILVALAFTYLAASLLMLLVVQQYPIFQYTWQIGVIYLLMGIGLVYLASSNSKLGLNTPGKKLLFLPTWFFSAPFFLVIAVNRHFGSKRHLQSNSE